MPAPRRDRGPAANRPHAGRSTPIRPGPARPGPGRPAPARPGPARPRLAHRAAEPLAWWTVLLSVYLGLVPTISITEITVGALAAAAGAAAAVAGRRALRTAATTPGPEPGHRSRSGCAPGAARAAAALAWLPGQVAADTARVIVRGASGGDWAPLPVAPGPGARGAATLLMSVSPGTYVGGIDPGRGLVRVHSTSVPSTPSGRS